MRTPVNGFVITATIAQPGRTGKPPRGLMCYASRAPATIDGSSLLRAERDERARREGTDEADGSLPAAPGATSTAEMRGTNEADGSFAAARRAWREGPNATLPTKQMGLWPHAPSVARRAQMRGGARRRHARRTL